MKATEFNPFEAISKEYDQWFDDNKVTFLSELAAVKYFLPKQGKGLEIGIGTGRFAMELGIKYGIEPSETIEQLKTGGFTKFNTCQSLFSIHPEKIEMPIPGHDKGSFVAIEAIKAY